MNSALPQNSSFQKEAHARIQIRPPLPQRKFLKMDRYFLRVICDSKIYSLDRDKHGRGTVKDVDLKRFMVWGPQHMGFFRRPTDIVIVLQLKTNKILRCPFRFSEPPKPLRFIRTGQSIGNKIIFSHGNYIIIKMIRQYRT